jgi:hypothetical protein
MANISDTIYMGSNNPAAATGDIISDKLGTAKPATTGSPPLPSPTKIAARVIKGQKYSESIFENPYR